MTHEICDSSDTDDTMSDSSEFTTTSPLLCLPQELRTLCFQHLLAGNNEVTFGKGSGLDLSILSVCRSVHDEVSELLYSKTHRIKIPCSSSSPRCKDRPKSLCCPTEGRAVNMPPQQALRRLKHVVLEVNFETYNRGECESYIIHHEGLLDTIMPVSMALPSSGCLRTLTIGLFNHAQRKVGNRRLRKPLLLHQMNVLLWPFAHLPRRIPILIDGFDTIEYVELFQTMREEHADKFISTIDWIEETLNTDVAGPCAKRGCA